MFYIIIIVLSLSFMYLAEKKENVYTKYFLYTISFLIIFLPHALRENIGTDYASIYKPLFFRLGIDINNGFSEPLFNLLNISVYKLSNANYKLFFAICSFITLFPIFNIIIKYSKNKTLSTVMVFLSQYYYFSMNAVRQSIAIALIFGGYGFLKENKKIKYVILCIIAGMFHFTGFIMLPLVFLKRKNIKTNRKIFYIVLFFVLGAIFKGVILRFIKEYTKYGVYINSQYDNGHNISGLLVLNNIMIFLYDIYYAKKISKNSNNMCFLSNINEMGMIFIALSPFIILANRLVQYFTVFQILLIPEDFKLVENDKVAYIMKIAIIGLLFASMCYQILILKGNEVYPYISIFD